MIKRIIFLVMALCLFRAQCFALEVGYSHGDGGEEIIASDNFNRATLGTDWTTVTSNGALTISSSTEVSGVTGVANAGYWASDSFSDAQYSEMIITNLSGGIGPAIRISASEYTFYYCSIDSAGTTASVYKYINGTRTTLSASIPCSYTLGQVVRLGAIGDTIILSINGTEIWSTTDASISSGYPGIRTYGTSGRGDNWVGGNL